MVVVLDKLLANPEPLPDESPPAKGSGTLPNGLLESLQERHYRRYDEQRGGWGRTHKFVNSPVVEYCLERSLAGSKKDEVMARTTLTNNLALLDPVWGGVYQYSDSGRWDSPHYEKIMSTQAGNLRVYSLAYAQYKDPAYLAAARSIAGYMTSFLLSPEGAFRPSQDADLVQGKKAHDYFSLSDIQRRKLGIPRIDPNLYARENGWAIEALALYAGIADDKVALSHALGAAEWVLLNRRIQGSQGFSHGPGPDGPFLGDTLACGRGFLALYQATGEPRWLDLAGECANAISGLFTRPGLDGAATVVNSDIRVAEENVDLLRFANLLDHYTGQKQHRDLAARALAFFTIEGVTDSFNAGGLLLAHQEFERDPLHITVVGAPGDAQAASLAGTARQGPSSYLRLDLWAPGTPLPPNTDVEYPPAARAAAYACRQGRCSAPVVTVQALRALLVQR
jgi:uncharacterized protein YyaL (SSP411 family)